MSPVRMSKVEASTRTALAYKDAFNNHDMDTILALLSDDCIFEPVQDGVVFKGKDEIKKYLEDVFSNVSPSELKIEDIFGMGLHVIMRWQMGSQRGVDIFKFRGELICEKLTYTKN